jgi:general nucleoside transport system permease protein
MDNQILFMLAITISSTLMFSAPLIYASMSGIISENAGVVNIGIEGMMVFGAFVAATVTFYTGNPWLGFICGGLGGAFFGLMHAIATIKFGANQVVSGIAINILSPAISLYLTRILFNGASSTPQVPTKIPTAFNDVFERHSFMQIVFNTYYTTYLAFILVFLVWYVLYKTKLGLRIRAVGEYPQSADTLGVNVYSIRYLCVITSGFFAGMAGASMSIALLSSFRIGLVSGHGFIAIAAVILGRWKPIKTLLGALFFGFCNALIILLGGPQIGITISPHLLSLIPYVSTLVLLIFIGNKYNGPAANGTPYVKGGR